MAVEAKQREWIWEFFLKNCTDARMIQELMNALPFPNENLDLKKMLLLRSLSLQITAGIIDELTLDILRGLGELSGVAEAARDRCSMDCCCEELARKRKVWETQKNDVEVACPGEVPISSSPQEKGGWVLPGNLDERKESSKDGRKADTVVGIRDWMKGRALPRSVGGIATEDPIVDTGRMNSGKAGSEFVFRPGQSAKYWELELLVMVELAVKHLRGGFPDRRLFELAVTKHWGDSMDDISEWPEVERREMVRTREQIKRELWMVRTKPELLDDVVERYSRGRVEYILKTHLEKAWAGTGQTFLERVSTDVVNGKYNPVNCNSQRPPKKAGSPWEDVDLGREGNGRDQTSEKPWIRASRGRYSRSREKVQKSFAIWDLESDEGGTAAKQPIDDRGREGVEKSTEHPHQIGGESHRQDGGHGEEVRVNVRDTNGEGGEASEGGPGIDVNSRRFKLSATDASVARVLEFEEPSVTKSIDGSQHREEVPDATRDETETTKAEGQTHQTVCNAFGERLFVDLTECSPRRCSVDTTRVPGASDVIYPSREGQAPTVDNENGTEAASNAKSTNLQGGAEPRCSHETVDKENAVPSSSPKSAYPNQHPVSFSPSPWVAGSPAVPSLTRKRKSGSITEEAEAPTHREDPRSTETEATTNCNDQGPDTMTAQRNLWRKQTLLDAIVQDPLPKILTTSRALSGVQDWNVTARSVEWPPEEAIEESQPGSPSASRNIRLPHPGTDHSISPLFGSRTPPINGTSPAAMGPRVIVRQNRRKPRRWTEKEVDSLKEEVGKYGKGRWKLILKKNMETFEGRTEVDLKDKWRNLERFEGVAN